MARAKLTKKSTRKSGSNTHIEKIVDEILGSEADSQQKVMKDIDVQTDNERHIIPEEKTKSSENKEYESEQDEMNDRRDQDAYDSHKTGRKEHNSHQYPSSRIDTEIRNQPLIKLVLELFGDDQNKEVTNNQEDGIEQQEADSISSNINEDKQRGSFEKSQEKVRTEENSCPEDGKEKNRQKRTGKKSKTKDTPSQRGKEQKQGTQNQVEENAMWRLKTKLQTLARSLSQWSRENIGDIYEQFNNWEVKVQQLEELDLQHNSENCREELNKAHVEYVKWLG
ncbi:PREDICTED: uncharacterized protein PFL1235c-like [Nicotiana attenuata]|uniref:uncharacterized protein PFL1235c-like n=1 Tax=Nicotiana attenuata TaxID=49451 RepID=UPI00090578B2|nr:PREDICTED: uncharacterized protein PFL1235c-like [Nicotiana attenuata]